MSSIRIKTEPQDSQQCPICWASPMINAIEIECRHIFCFLCIKSAVSTGGNCPLCRQEIDADLIGRGELPLVGQPKLPSPNREGCLWFYSGRRGWWLYDADTNRELEDAHQNGLKKIEKLIAGKVYVINIIKLKQYQKDDPTRTREVRRARFEDVETVGMAGLRDQKILDELRNLTDETYDLRF